MPTGAQGPGAACVYCCYNALARAPFGPGPRRRRHGECFQNVTALDGLRDAVGVLSRLCLRL